MSRNLYHSSHRPSRLAPDLGKGLRQIDARVSTEIANSTEKLSGQAIDWLRLSIGASLLDAALQIETVELFDADPTEPYQRSSTFIRGGLCMLGSIELSDRAVMAKLNLTPTHSCIDMVNKDGVVSQESAEDILTSSLAALEGFEVEEPLVEISETLGMGPELVPYFHAGAGWVLREAGVVECPGAIL
jgi:hypothetical protein